MYSNVLSLAKTVRIFFLCCFPSILIAHQVERSARTPKVHGSNPPPCSDFSFLKLNRKISLLSYFLHDEQPRVITQRKNIFHMMKKQPDSRLVPVWLHCSRMERSIQKDTAYKVPGAEAPGQKRPGAFFWH